MSLQWVFEFCFNAFLFVVLPILGFIISLVIFTFFLAIIVFSIRVLYRLLFCRQGLKESIKDMKEQNAIESLRQTDFIQKD